MKSTTLWRRLDSDLWARRKDGQSELIGRSPKWEGWRWYQLIKRNGEYIGIDDGVVYKTAAAARAAHPNEVAK